MKHFLNSAIGYFGPFGPFCVQLFKPLSNISFPNNGRDTTPPTDRLLAQLGIPMATAIDMYLKQISLVGGIPFSVVLPKTASTVNADMMPVEEIHRKLEKGYADIEKGNVEDAASAFAAFRERH